MMKKTNNIKSIISQYKFNSIFYQYFKTIFIYFSVPCMILCAVIGIIYINHYNSIVELNSVLSSQKIDKSVNNVFEEINNTYILLNSNQNMQNCLLMDSDTFYKFDNYSLTNALNTLLSNTVFTSNVIDSVYMYSFSNDYVYASSRLNGVNSNFLEKFNDTLWYEEYISDPKPSAVKSFYIPAYARNMISVICETTANNAVTGILVFNVSTDNIVNVCVSENTSYNEKIYLLDNNNNIVFSNTDTCLDFDLYDYDTENTISYTKKGSYSLCSSLIGDMNIRLVMLFDFSQSKINLTSTLIITVIMLSVIIILPIIVAFMLSSKFYSSIADIIYYLMDPQYSNSESSNTHNELNFIFNNIKNLKKTSKSLEKSLADNLTKLKESQIINLQMQLNPHFLFNTLNSLVLLNSNNTRKDEFQLLVRNLSNIMAYTLDTRNNWCTIAEDIDYTKNFIQIEETKYQRHLNIEWNIDYPLCNLSIIKFMFQPIIENSMRHGFKYDFDKNCKITVNAIAENNCLTITVTDNGIGMNVNTVKELNAKFEEGYFPQKTHIGLLNLNKRIKLITNDSYGCEISSVPNYGTTVTIRFPITKSTL